MTITEADRRRHAIRVFARKYKGQPLQPHVLQREVWCATGLAPSKATIRRDMKAIIDAHPHAYGLRRGALQFG